MVDTPRHELNFFLLITDLSDNSDFFFLNGAASVKSDESVIN